MVHANAAGSPCAGLASPRPGRHGDVEGETDGGSFGRARAFTERSTCAAVPNANEDQDQLRADRPVAIASRRTSLGSTVRTERRPADGKSSRHACDSNISGLVHIRRCRPQESLPYRSVSIERATSNRPPGSSGLPQSHGNDPRDPSWFFLMCRHPSRFCRPSAARLARSDSRHGTQRPRPATRCALGLWASGKPRLRP